MKFLLIMFVFLCIHTTSPVKGERKAAAKKEAKASFRLAPSILIVNY
jgi:hypothetical protein